MCDSPLDPNVTNADAAARMAVLRDDWMLHNGAEYERWATVVKRMEAEPNLKSHELRWLSDCVLRREIAQGDPRPQDCWHVQMLKNNFMQWLRKYSPDEWRVVALWVDEEVREEDPEYYAEHFRNGSPGQWFYDDDKLIDCIAALLRKTGLVRGLMVTFVIIFTILFWDTFNVVAFRGARADFADFCVENMSMNSTNCETLYKFVHDSSRTPGENSMSAFLYNIFRLPRWPKVLRALLSGRTSGVAAWTTKPTVPQKHPRQ